MHDTEAPLRVPELPNNYSSLREEASTDTPLQQATLHAMTVSPNSQSSSESTLHFDDDDGILSPSNEEQPQTYHHRSTDMLDNRFQDEQRPSSSLQQRALAICAMSVVMTVACLATSTWSTVGFLGQPSATTTNGISEPDPLSLSTTNTVVEVPLHHPPENRIEMEEHRRWMEETTDLVCNDFYNTTYSETLWDQADGGNDTTATEDYISGVSCEPIGQITFEDAVILYQELCPNWPFDDQDNENETSSCGLVGAEEVLLTCKNRKTRILGGEYFPDGGYPAVDGEYTVFPAPTNSKVLANYYFTALQLIPDPSGANLKPCLQEFQMKLYCQEGTSNKCLVFSSIAADAPKCPGTVALCPGTGSGALFSSGQGRNLRRG